MTNSPAIETKALSMRFGDTYAVSNLDIIVPRGSVFGFLGPNGAGKSTTIRMLLGLIRPTSGSASVLGFDIERERNQIATRIGAIVETPTFYGYMTGAENLNVFALSSNIRMTKSQTAQMLERVGLAEAANKKVSKYSLGMKQRLGLAATLLSDPELLFLDEPTNGLDPAGTVEMRKLIRELSNEGRTVFLSSHVLSEIEQVCTDIAIIQSGVNRMHGKVSELLRSRQLFSIRATPLERALIILKQQQSIEAVGCEDGSVEIKCDESQLPSLVRALVNADVNVFQVQQKEQTLENVFLELTAESNKPIDLAKAS